MLLSQPYNFSNQQLSDSQKFHFLKDSLPAVRYCDIQQIQLTDARWHGQCSSSGIITHATHMNALYNLSTQHKEKAEDLLSLLSTVNVGKGALQRIMGSAKEHTHWLAHYVPQKIAEGDAHGLEILYGQQHRGVILFPTGAVLEPRKKRTNKIKNNFHDLTTIRSLSSVHKKRTPRGQIMNI